MCVCVYVCAVLGNGEKKLAEEFRWQCCCMPRRASVVNLLSIKSGKLSGASKYQQ